MTAPSPRRPRMSLWRMAASLGAITCVAAALLAIVYNITKEPIARAAGAAQTAAVEAVAPEFDNNPAAEADTVRLPGEPMPVTIYPARISGRLTGAAVETWTQDGFSGLITLMVGLTADGRVTDYRVLSHSETPGLGAKMDTWFRDTTGHRSILGINPSASHFWVAKDPGGDIDGITAATITSRAFLQAVKRAADAFTIYKEQHP